MENEKEILLKLYKKSRDKLESQRAHAILLVKEGHKNREVAKLFFVDADSVGSWVKRWDKIKSTDDMLRSGRPKVIDSTIEKRICEIVDENEPQKHGVHASTWDCRELRIWLLKMYGLKISNEQIRKVLKRNGFKYRKLNHKFVKADDKQRNHFFDNFKGLADDKKGTFIFQDEMSSKLHPNKGRIWTRENKPFIETECSHKKTFVVGGVAPDKGKVFTITDNKFNSEVFIRFLKLILSSTRGPILLVIDNHPVHHSKKVKDFLDDKHRIQLIPLPKYSPDLNPQENLWNYLRKKYLNNKIFKSVADMAFGIMEFIKSIPKKIVKSVGNYDYLLR